LEIESVPEAADISRAMKHPAVHLGAWLKARRQQAGMVLRVFAGQIELSPAEYAEAEAGVVRWLSEEQEATIPQVLGLAEPERKEFLSLLAKARAAKPLAFDDLFTRAQLEPMRLRHAKGKQAAARAKKEILDAVFAPLK
jgi:transcriptional regulator with XRE-family HTH domain